MELWREFLMPPDIKEMFLSSVSCEVEKVIYFFLAAERDIFRPASADLFYGTVAGSRIASGRTRILVPTSTSSSSHLSPCIFEKKRYAYSCFCWVPTKSRFSSESNHLLSLSLSLWMPMFRVLQGLAPQISVLYVSCKCELAGIAVDALWTGSI